MCLADDLEVDGISVAAMHPGRLLTKMAPNDAAMTPMKSAELIYDAIAKGQINSRDFLCMETGKLAW
ncbi:hypothetical protein CS022_13685 [Veronia nyctiphanis]|uniref:Short-chain dehydrogenase n=1 Tax=Veronia nyctiphanis TaxID=1278244 RepID=A0A4Q0YU28_9GAMM|nr:hypothetical protein [Veronia nyctiphanis]RXJ72689.1 hypothetical protein CS022_13685 [Veronia nyctiphanis]